MYRFAVSCEHFTTDDAKIPHRPSISRVNSRRSDAEERHLYVIKTDRKRNHRRMHEAHSAQNITLKTVSAQTTAAAVIWLRASRRD